MPQLICDIFIGIAKSFPSMPLRIVYLEKSRPRDCSALTQSPVDYRGVVGEGASSARWPASACSRKPNCAAQLL